MDAGRCEDDEDEGGSVLQRTPCWAPILGRCRCCSIPTEPPVVPQGPSWFPRLFTPTGTPGSPPALAPSRLPEGGQEAVVVTPRGRQVHPAPIRGVQAPGSLHGSENPGNRDQSGWDKPPRTPPSILGPPQAAANPKDLGAGCGAGCLGALVTGGADEGTAENSWEGVRWDTPALPYLDQVGRRSPPLLKMLLPMLLLHFEGEAGAQDPLGTGGDGDVSGGTDRAPHRGGSAPFLPCFLQRKPSPLLTAGRAKKEMPSRANPAASIRPSHVCGALSP